MLGLSQHSTHRKIRATRIDLLALNILANSFTIRHICHNLRILFKLSIDLSMPKCNPFQALSIPTPKWRKKETLPPPLLLRRPIITLVPIRVVAPSYQTST